jgi:hypothetical protein
MLYDQRSYKHKILFCNEADAFAVKSRKDADNAGVALLRGLLESNKMSYSSVSPVKDDIPKGVLIEKEGPTGFILTGTQHADPEIENRCLLLSPDESHQQTVKVLRAQAEAEATPSTPKPDLTPWHSLQRVIQAKAPWDVRVSFARQLQTRIGELANCTRRRRDFPQLLNLIKACAVLHHAQRETDPQDGALLASVEDYAMVVDLVALLFPLDETGLTSQELEAYKACKRLAERDPVLTAKRVAKALDVSLPTAKTRMRALVKAELATEREPDSGKAITWRLSEYTIEFGSALPTVEELRSLVGQVGVSAEFDVTTTSLSPLIFTPTEAPRAAPSQACNATQEPRDFHPLDSDETGSCGQSEPSEKARGENRVSLLLGRYGGCGARGGVESENTGALSVELATVATTTDPDPDRTKTEGVQLPYNNCSNKNIGEGTSPCPPPLEERIELSTPLERDELRRDSAEVEAYFERLKQEGP